MAYLIRLFPRVADGAGRPHSAAEGSWTVSEREGKKVLQIDTYGSRDRKDVGTVSQSLQIDEERARELLQIILNTFPGIQS